MKLSKTNFLVWRDCAHNAWVKMHRPDVYYAKPLSVFDQNIIDEGNDIDVLARDLFPGGVVIERTDVEGTAKLIAERAAVLYQPVIETEQFTIAADIMVWNKECEAYDLYEVKASTSGDDKKAKDELYTYDIGFQSVVLRQAGVPLGRVHLVRLNSEYVRGDELDVDQLFTREDFTDRVAANSGSLKAEMEQAFAELSKSAQPNSPCSCIYKGRNSHCTSFAFLNPQVPSYSVHDITRIGASKKKLRELIEAGILEVSLVPSDFPLSGPQQNQVQVAKSQQPIIDHEAIASFLADISYPVSFLDYETYPSAKPLYPGYGPYDQIPFQFSLDVVRAPGAAMEHYEFLHTTTECPDRAIIAALEEVMPRQGSVIVWNQSFERGINDKLVERCPEAREFMAGIDVRIRDLMDVFAMQFYVHPGFKGKSSIKYVLPVMAPNLSYSQLAIREGATATARWAEVVLGGMDAEAVAKLRADLLAYCGLDTLAMVEIWRALLREIEGAKASAA